MVNNCTECKFKKTAFSDLTKVSKEMTEVRNGFYVQCLAGNNEIILDFYSRNMDIPNGGKNEEVLCFEKTDFRKQTDSLISSIEDFIETVKKA